MISKRHINECECSWSFIDEYILITSDALCSSGGSVSITIVVAAVMETSAGMSTSAVTSWRIRAGSVPGVVSTTMFRVHQQDKAEEEASPHLQVCVYMCVKVYWYILYIYWLKMYCINNSHSKKVKVSYAKQT